MTWNYRIMRHKVGAPINEEYYELHEVYYDEQGKPDGWTKNAKSPFGDTPDELIECLEMMLSDAKKCKDDILDYDAEPTGTGFKDELESLDEEPEP